MENFVLFFIVKLQSANHYTNIKVYTSSIIAVVGLIVMYNVFTVHLRAQKM